LGFYFLECECWKLEKIPALSIDIHQLLNVSIFQEIQLSKGHLEHETYLSSGIILLWNKLFTFKIQKKHDYKIWNTRSKSENSFGFLAETFLY